MVTHLLTPVLVSARRSASPFRPARTTRAGSEPYVPPPSYWNREGSVPRGGPSVFDRATSLAPFTRPSFRASSLEPLDELFERKLPAIAEADSAPADAPSRPLGIFERAGSPSPTPVKAGRWGPRPTEVAYDAEGKNPNFTYTFPTKKKKNSKKRRNLRVLLKIYVTLCRLPLPLEMRDKTMMEFMMAMMCGERVEKSLPYFSRRVRTTFAHSAHLVAIYNLSKLFSLLGFASTSICRVLSLSLPAASAKLVQYCPKCKRRAFRPRRQIDLMIFKFSKWQKHIGNS